MPHNLIPSPPRPPARQPRWHRDPALRSRHGRVLATAIAAPRRLGQRAGALVPLSRFPRIPPDVGAARRRRLGARPRLLPRSLFDVQRHPGGAAAPPRRAGNRGRVMSSPADRRLTVLMTADAVGGVWNYTLALCAALPAFRFVLAVMGPSPSETQRMAVARLDNVVLEEAPYRLEWMAGAHADLGASPPWLASL